MDTSAEDLFVGSSGHLYARTQPGLHGIALPRITDLTRSDPGSKETVAQGLGRIVGPFDR